MGVLFFLPVFSFLFFLPVFSAQTQLGLMFEKGQGVKQDYAKALLRYINAAVLGQATAQDNLGCMYLHGRGVKQDYAKALSWFRRAAEKKIGHPFFSAEIFMGVLFFCYLSTNLATKGKNESD